MDTQRKWSTTKQEAYEVYYAVTDWNYYLQGADVIICKDHNHWPDFQWKECQQQSKQMGFGTCKM